MYLYFYFIPICTIVSLSIYIYTYIYIYIYVYTVYIYIYIYIWYSIQAVSCFEFLKTPCGLFLSFLYSIRLILSALGKCCQNLACFLWIFESSFANIGPKRDSQNNDISSSTPHANGPKTEVVSAIKYTKVTKYI